MNRTKVALGVSGGGITALVVGLVGWAWIAGKPTDFWASAGQWIGGIGSIAAAAAAVWVALTSWRQSAEERRMFDEDKLRQAASLFVIWTVRAPGGREIEVWCSNATQAPMFDVAIRLVVAGTTSDPISLDNVGPTTEARKHEMATQALQRAVSRTLGPETDDQGLTPFQAGYNGDRNDPRQRLNVINDAEVYSTYRDPSGLVWQRGSKGRLSRVD